MIKEIISMFDEKVFQIIDYNDKYYLAEVGNLEHTEMYAINKKTKEITSYSIGMDTDNFYDALENRLIYSVK